MTGDVNPYNQVLDNMRRSEPLIARYCDGGDSHVLKAEIAARIEEKALHIIVYGAYNSGKSTLINVLLGEAQAARRRHTDDRPRGYLRLERISIARHSGRQRADRT